MFLIAYAFKGQVHVFAGRVKVVSHSSCRTSAILKYFCPLQSIGDDCYYVKIKLCILIDMIINSNSRIVIFIFCIV